MNNICDKVKQLKKSGPEDLFYQWKTIHDELEILNLQEIQRFYREKKEISYLNSYENNENGILIIGGSGVGKTTLFLSLAGEKMIKKKIKSRSAEFENYQAAD
jgi:DNA replication protein DnaC